jgi:hypothetical protein
MSQVRNQLDAGNRQSCGLAFDPEEEGADMKNGAFWDVRPRGSCKNRRFGGTTRLTIPEDAILHSHRRENLKSYKEETFSSAM